jgi:YidC/Oxa1 family membrane protein insertase
MVAHMYCGNLGLAIITLSLATRLALLPLTLRMARYAQAQQRIMLGLRDEISKLRKRYKSDPRQLSEKISDLYREHELKPVDLRHLAGGAAQAFIGAGLYSAIRRGVAQGHHFLWIQDLALPDAILTLATGAITLAASLIGPHLPEQSRTAAAVLPAVLTVFLAWRLSSAIVLYWASSAAVSGVQGFMLRKRGA